MKIVQIIGPSYCGSTVLGYALNTIDGFFFSSEARRLLLSFREKNGNTFPICDLCGVNCKYWSESFFEKIKNVDNLQDLYDKFEEENPQIEYFVDSSKLLDEYEGTYPFGKIVCVKHPIRMLASQLYNLRKKLNIGSSSYNAVYSYIDNNQDEVLAYSDDYLKRLSETYSSIFRQVNSFFYFKTDEAHFDDMKIFRDLKEYLGILRSDIDVVNFSKYTCHSLGGNRAPVFLMKRANEIEVKSNARFNFYDRAESFGDWKIDQKYIEILPSSFLEKIYSNSSFRKCVDLLGYNISA